MSITELPETFDPQTEEGNTWDLLPIGEYVAQAIETKVAPPGTGDGYALTITWQITEGPYENRQLWQHITFQHSSEVAQKIGRKTFKDICDALDIHEAVHDTSIIQFKPVRLRVGIAKDKNGVYPDQNKVSRVMPFAVAPDTTAAPAGQPSSPKTGNDTTAAAGTAKPTPAPRTQGTPRSGPAGTAPWHAKR